MKRLLHLFFAVAALPATAAPPDGLLHKSASIFAETPPSNSYEYIRMIGVQYENKVGRTRAFRLSLALADVRYTVSPPSIPRGLYPVYLNTAQEGTIGLLCAGMTWSTPQFAGFSGYAGPEFRLGVGNNRIYSGQFENIPFYYMGLSGVMGGKFTFERTFINAEISNGFSGGFTKQEHFNGEKHWRGDGSIDFLAVQFRLGVGHIL